MKYPYSVKVNGKWYRPNAEVPETVSEMEKVEKPVETVEAEQEKPKRTAKK